MASKRVLFIDDDFRLFEKALRKQLGKAGFEIRCEEDPFNVLRVISSYHPDVILLDILFPEGYLGKPTLEKIKKKHPNMPVMMITGTMDKSEYKSEHYLLADYRYSKEALTAGDFSDLAAQLNRLIERAEAQEQGDEDNTGLDSFGFIVGKSKAMHEVAEMVEKVADQEHTVLITGESGTGKKLVARSVHDKSRRQNRNFVTIVCAALSKELLESELFGHEKGAFTSAVSDKKGKFEVAGDGTIFLDEIGDMPLDTQVKLLRFVEEREFERVGGNEVLRSNARIIAATNQDLHDLVAKRDFREDLFFRLNVLSIHMPPLRERKEDIPVFFEHFINKANEDSRKKVLPILREDVRLMLLSYTWPGNIRLFENLINRAVAIADENILQVNNFPDLSKKMAQENGVPSDVPYIVDRILKGELTWSDISKEFGAKGMIRKEVLSRTIDRWVNENQRRPSSEDLGTLLSTTPGNMRRILSECGIKLTEMTK
ncbi:MAG: sigma-54-dependent Fis family transcriptional regulator [Deltaproteobacteria bacterium]|nr:sigma-54-dependent Fis family transcriptional regulator [Deltaproteobacteria bacterium]MBL7075345.1 sigma-54-dependent Fis family transcriptional regulator [candidate division KSB1 bacterium]